MVNFQLFGHLDEEMPCDIIDAMNSTSHPGMPNTKGASGFITKGKAYISQRPEIMLQKNNIIYSLVCIPFF
jgi:hypothetical protein